MSDKAKYFIRPFEYTVDESFQWDAFVEQSVNGTFLQSRRFLGYHPQGRFVDRSLMIYDGKQHLVAVCPAAERVDETGRRCFISHPGSTFGDVIFSPKAYVAHKVIDILAVFEEYLVQQGYAYAELRLTADVFARQQMALWEYALYHAGWKEQIELNTYIDYAQYPQEILSALDQGKRTNVHNCQRKGLGVREISAKEDISKFYNLLCVTLSKYNVEPVHTLPELLDLQERLPNECGFWGGFLSGTNPHDKEMVAGGMMFYFREINMAHTQYLCANPKYNRLSPMTFLYYSLIVEMRKRGFQGLSFGISTEERGRVLNMGLTDSKEAYGAVHAVNRIFSKHF